LKKQLNIGVFGSSYSRGNSSFRDPDRPYKKYKITSWPDELSKMCEHQIWNHSIGGASVNFMLEQYWKHKSKNFDFVIFDAASPMRYTVELQNIKMERQTQNYNEYTYDNIDESVLRYTVNRSFTRQENESIHYNKWKRMIAFESEQAKASHADACIEISKVADILFFQRRTEYKEAFYKRIDLKRHPCVQLMLPAEKWQSYILDKACHFNTNGSKWLARWMLEQINTIYFGETKSA
tara:strand:- start:112 stop:822 length:711 start_codon:yes stop_codon:yes gene_type:complete